MEETLLAIRDRGLLRATAGLRRYPKHIRKIMPLTDAEKQETRDSRYLDSLKNATAGTHPPLSGNAKVLWDEIISWKTMEYSKYR